MGLIYSCQPLLDYAAFLIIQHTDEVGIDPLLIYGPGSQKGPLALTRNDRIRASPIILRSFAFKEVEQRENKRREAKERANLIANTLFRSFQRTDGI